MKGVNGIFALFATVFIACSGNNPLVGTWEAKYEDEEGLFIWQIYFFDNYSFESSMQVDESIWTFRGKYEKSGPVWYMNCEQGYRELGLMQRMHMTVHEKDRLLILDLGEVEDEFGEGRAAQLFKKVSSKTGVSGTSS